MQIIKFNENIDKFTGFFDKKRAEKFLVTYCNIMIIDKYMSANRSDKATKFFQPPHLPAFTMT